MDSDIIFLLLPLAGLGGLLVVVFFFIQLAGINRKLRRANEALAELVRLAGQR